MYLFLLYYYFISHHFIFSPPSEPYRHRRHALLRPPSESYLLFLYVTLIVFSLSSAAVSALPSVNYSDDQTLIGLLFTQRREETLVAQAGSRKSNFSLLKAKPFSKTFTTITGADLVSIY
ncbi:hypothetical protein QL285_002993 [Trifolium repens]|jgi:hypothetical protein|nr:hypothetical protein QL285_002993 [Trifolium repens]